MFRDVFEALKSVASKWYNIGLELDLDGSQLHNVESDLKASPSSINHEKLLEETLKIRLETGELSWKDVVHALNRVGEGAMAERLAQEHSKIKGTQSVSLS